MRCRPFQFIFYLYPPVLAAGGCRKGVKEMTAATIKKIKAVKPPHPFEAYSHVISQIPKEDGGGFLITFTRPSRLPVGW